MKLRRGEEKDLKFITKADLKNEGYTIIKKEKRSYSCLKKHYKLMKTFIVNEQKGSFVVEDETRELQVGFILYRIKNLKNIRSFEVFNKIDRKFFPDNGEFLEVFQLWINPLYRKRGLATLLKKQLEIEAKSRNIKVIYTHTEEKNEHVIDMNLKLGYFEVRKGPIWDETVRVSLIKRLT
ncbi:GNAT family N-acetyltransferase [Chengkuizengella sediminis]|uniref:GNAT family N-acetyltransferase n=1 Tax=Chengkuizengella sediminis TaxID=1885917 RepID=UPI0013893D3C|nr:GNAT family N-acetyltransferase [Chengkuizengella sediminis]NDI35754.1 GNAT family N-acetyltransferase [Chengkuizengella sediminis]